MYLLVDQLRSYWKQKRRKRRITNRKRVSRQMVIKIDLEVTVKNNKINVELRLKLSCKAFNNIIIVVVPAKRRWFVLVTLEVTELNNVRIIP